MNALGRWDDWIRLSSTWWFQQLEAALPDVIRRPSTTRGTARLLVTPGDGGVSIALLDRDGTTIFAECATWADYRSVMLDECRRRAAALTRPRPLVVSVAVPQAIDASMMIPRRARDQAERLVRDQVARKCPLPLGDIAIAWNLAEAAAGKIRVTYLALPRPMLDQTLQRLGLAFADVATIEGASGAAAPLASAAEVKRGGGRRMTGWVAGSLIAATLVGYVALVAVQQAALADLDTALAQLETPWREAARNARILSRRRDDIMTFAKLREAPGVIRIWDQLAEIVPVSAYLTELDVSETTLQLSGFSESTPALIHLLQGAPFLQQAALSGPITSDAATGRERFSIQATLAVPRAPPEGPN